MAGEMSASRIATRIALLLLAGALTLGTSPAFAHTGATSIASSVVGPPAVPSPTLESRVAVLAATPSVDLSLLGALAGLVLLTVLLRAPRRVAVVTFAILIAVLAFQTGVHAVHHLGDRHAASHCAVASVAPHVGGTTHAPPSGMPSLDASPDVIVVANVATLPARSLRPSPGRAPPALPA